MKWVAFLIMLPFVWGLAAWPLYALWLVEWLLSPMGPEERTVYLIAKVIWVFLQALCIVKAFAATFAMLGVTLKD